MKHVLVLLLFLSGASFADVVTSSTNAYEMAFTNAQKHSVWTPTALIYTRGDIQPVSLTVHRHGDGAPVLLASISATASNLIWIPPGRFLFPYQSSLVVSSSVANFSVQLHREAADD